MCGIPSIFVTLNISNAIGFTCFGVHTRKLLHFRFYSFTAFRPESPVFWTGVSGPWFSSRVFFLFSPWWGPEYPPQARVSGPRGRSFCLSFSRLFVVHLLVGAGVSAPGRSIRSLGPETPVCFWLQRLLFWEGYKYPSTFLQPASSAQQPLLSLSSIVASSFP